MTARGSGFSKTFDAEKRIVRRTSVSAITTFSQHEYGGCNRKFYFSKILGIEEPKTAALDIGSSVHSQIEHYEKTGEDTLGTIARQGKHFIPEPGPGILIEQPFGSDKIVEAFERWSMIQEAVAKCEATRERADQWFKENIPASTLYAHGVPFVGYIDVVNLRPYWLDNDGVRQPMPPKSIEVHDHKTTSNIDLYAKSNLENTVQMVGYAEWAHRQWPDLELFRLSHGYFQTKGRGAEKRTVLISLDTVQKKWKGIEEQVLRMTQVARETDVSKVEPNYDSCNAYGRDGCFYKSICPRDPDRALMDLLQPNTHGNQNQSLPGENSMSNLFDMLNDAAPTTVHTPPPPVPPTLPVTPAHTSVEDAKAKLLATEAAARAAGGIVVAVAETTVADVMMCKSCNVPLTSTNTSKLPNGVVWHMTDTPHDCGVSAVPAAAVPAAAVAAAPGITAAGAATLAEVKAGLAGLNGHAHGASKPAYDDPFGDLGASPTTSARNAVSPPDAPASGVEAALHIPPEQKLVMSPEIVVAAAAFDPPAPPVVVSNEPVVASASAAAATAADVVQEKVKRRKKGESAELPPVIPSITPPAASPIAPSAQADANGASTMHLYVDCHVSFPTTDLEVYVSKLAEALAKTYNVSDIRCAPGDSVLAYSKWKGVLAAAAATSLPKGACSLNFVGQSELKQVVVEALRPHAEVFVRGTR